MLSALFLPTYWKVLYTAPKIFVVSSKTVKSLLLLLDHDIVADVLDAETKKLLWQGVGTGVLGDKEGEVELMLNQSVADIFNQYPVKPISDN